MNTIQDGQGEYGENSAYILWVDGKASKISSDRACLIPHANQALHDQLSCEITYHSHYKDAYKVFLSGISFDKYMVDLLTPNPNRFVKSSFALSLLWVAKLYTSLNYQYKFGSQVEFKLALFSSNAISAFCKLLNCQPFADRKNLYFISKWLHN